ncbi:Urb1p [Rhodotorula paludigena]|uniref:Urb1p n=1 Tax=Rhodotorula paludigena TaxID=86838 RepID=UPI00317CFA79
MAEAGAAARPTKGQQVTIAPFDSHIAVVQALQTRDPAHLQAALVQVDKRALALVAKPAPRAAPDLLLDYLKHNPGCEGVFAAWDLANKTNNSPLSTAVLSCLTSLIRLLSTDPFTPSPELVKTLLSAKYAPYFDRSLNPGRNDVTTAALKLCNVLVGFGGGRFARRVFGSFSWSPKVTTRLFKTRLRTLTSSNVLHKPDIRTLLVLLVLSFLSAGDVRLKSQVLETKGLLAGVWKGLNEDPEVVVNLVLETVGRELVLERRVGLEARRNVFDEACVNELVKLYDYPLPSGDAPVSPSHPTLSIGRFLQLISTWLADQIASSPVGRSSGPQKVLSTILRALKVTEESTQRALGLEILRAAPILAGAFWAKFPSSLDPRLSSRWVSAITFATQVVGLPVAPSLSLSPSASPDAQAAQAPPSVSSILDTILPPASGASLTRAWYTKALSHDTPLVSFLSSLFLLAILQKAACALAALAEASATLEEGDGGRWAATARRVREELRTRLPDPSIVVALMTKTAMAASSGGSSGKKGDAMAAVEDKPATTSAVAAAAGGEGALLRTNVALRILFLYHRVAPQLIATLKYDFAKLPQTYARVNTSATADDSDGDEPATRAEGLRAISSAYALRLAAAHTSSAHASSAAFARPQDYFKSSLAPLFELYRAPATPSNRSLLRAILRRQLGSAVLFGQKDAASDEGAEEEVDVWLRALPVPSDDGDDAAGASEVLAFFEEAVRKTLTAPIKLGASAASPAEQESFSPLLKTFLAALAALDTPPSAALLRFAQALVLELVAHHTTLDLPRRVVAALEAALTQPQSSGTLETLRECLAVAEGQAGHVKPAKGLEALAEADEDELAMRVQACAPRTANVFAALEGQEVEVVKRALSFMPLPLALLHVRTADLADPSKKEVLLDLVAAKGLHLPAIQLLLHRFIGLPSEQFAAFIEELYHTTNVETVKKVIRGRIAGPQGLLSVFAREGLDAAAYEVAVNLLGRVLDSRRLAEKELVQPFCDLVLRDLNPAASPTKKRKHRASSPPASVTLAPRVLAAAPLLPFFDTSSSLPLLEALLAQLPSSPSSSATALLSAALTRVVELPHSPAFTAFWTAQFERLNLLASVPELAAPAGAVLSKGAEALLPFSTLAQRDSSSDAWRLHAEKWTTSLLASPTIALAQAKALSALVYRSSVAREALAAWLGDNAQGVQLVALAEPIEALLEVARAQGVKANVADSIAAEFVRQLLEREYVAGEASACRTAQKLAGGSNEAAAQVKAQFDAHVAQLGRDGCSAWDVRVVAAVAEKEASLEATLQTLVGGALEGLVRRYADQEADDEVVKALVEQLAVVLETHSGLMLRTPSLDPLLTNTVTRRLDQIYAMRLATALCRQHRFKDNEITRHLNEIFASPVFLAFAANQSDSADAAAAVIALALALGTTSPVAADNARTVERLIPFYRGTLAPTDRALLDLFQRIELVGGSSISPTLAGWNPSTDSTTLLDGSRVSALGATQKSFVRRSWARAFASTRTTYSAAEDAKTYDPRFIVGIVAALAEEDELKPQEWTVLLESGALGTAVAALASSETGLRGLARTALAALLRKIQPLTFREKDELLLLLTQVRLAIYSQAGEPLPSTIALFLAHCVSLIGAPESPLYPAFMRFLLQRSTVDSRDVPMFYLMLYSSNADEFAAAPREERVWMVRFLTEGLVRTQDWKIYRRRQVFELLASLFQSSRQDPQLRKLVLEFLVRATSIPTAARELLSRNGILGWLSAQIPLDVAERRLLVQIVVNMVEVLPWDKMAGVADAVEALDNAVGKDVSVIDPSTLLDLVRHIVAHISPSLSSPLLSLVLASLSSLVSSIAATVTSSTPPAPLAHRLYATTMVLSFVRGEAGLREGSAERKMWSQAVRAGLQAGDDEIKLEVLRIACR